VQEGQPARTRYGFGENPTGNEPADFAAHTRYDCVEQFKESIKVKALAPVVENTDDSFGSRPRLI